MAPSRRTVLTTGAAGLVTAAASANAQTTTGQGSPPQPVLPGRGGTDPGPRNLPRDLQNPDIYTPPRPTTARCRTCASPSMTRTCGWIPAAGPARSRCATRHLQEHRRREHAPQRRRRARAALAQGRRVGLRALRQRAHHGRRPGRAQFRRRRRRGRPVVFPAGHSALDPGPWPRRHRVPAGVRRRRFRRGQHLPPQRLAEAHSTRGAGQELRRAGIALRQRARSRASSTCSPRRCRDRLPPTSIAGAVPVPQHSSATA